jgi:hypothetical protein
MQRMVFRLLMGCMLMLAPFSTQNQKVNYPECEYKGIKLNGKVKFVSSFPDIKVQFVTSFPDIKVKFVEHFPDKCGAWQIVENFPDIKIQVVESFPDIKVQVVNNFPGKP